MSRRRSRSILTLAVAWFAPLSLVLILSLAGGVAVAAAQDMSDDEFISSLSTLPTHEELDRKRLARVFFGVAATLEGGRSSVQLLHGSLAVPDSSRQAVQGLLRKRYASYSDSLDRFRRSSARLLDEPESLLFVYRSLLEGQRACWHFDLHNRLIQAYGTDTDQLSILASREACVRLRTLAFEPRVESVIRTALVEHVFQRAEFDDIEDELAACEDLVEDLSKIDDGR